MKLTLTSLLLLLAVFSHAAIADSLVQETPIATADLASHLGVFAQSLTYRQDQPFTSLSFALTFKERLPDGTYAEKAEILAGTYSHYESPKTEVTIAVFLDKEHSTIISGPHASHGRGFDVGRLYTTGNHPPFRQGGGYILLRTTLDPKVTDTEANTKGILELELKAAE